MRLALVLFPLLVAVTANTIVTGWLPPRVNTILNTMTRPFATLPFRPTVLQRPVIFLQPPRQYYVPPSNVIAPIASNNIQESNSQFVASAPGQYKPNIIHEEAKESSHSHFGYEGSEGPEHWADHFPACGGLRQSPIDINEYNLETASMGPLTRKGYWGQADTMRLVNNGHTLEMTGTWPAGKVPELSDGPLKDKYLFQQVHIHWGKNDFEGSEHTVNGNRMPMEMHMVHFNKKYGSFENASKEKDGLAVLAFFFRIGAQNRMIGEMISYTNSVEGNEKKEVEINDCPPLNALFMDTNETITNYVTYEGSLTTPPCTENVIWLISTVPLTLSDDQMQQLRSVVTDEEDENIHNYRPLQNLNGRPVIMNV